MDLDADGKKERVSRSVANPKRIFVEGEWHLPLDPTKKKGDISPAYSDHEWWSILGHLWYGLPLDSPSYTPTFRSLISYAIRRGSISYHSPFRQSKEQQEWDSQLHLAYLLGLHWEDAAHLHKVKIQKDGLKDLRSAVKSGVLSGFSGERAELVAKRSRLSKETQGLSEELADFRVLENYRQIQEESNVLTVELHAVTESLFLKKRVLESYRANQSQEPAPTQDEIGGLYAEIGIQLPNLIRKKFEEVQAFHEALVSNRTTFLAGEAIHLETEIQSLEAGQSQLEVRRANLLRILEDHGALEEYSRLQGHLLKRREEVHQLDSLIQNLDSLKEGDRALTIERATTVQSGSQDFKERFEICEKAITIFNEYSQYLYEAPGNLLLDFDENGFNFNIEIERSGSSGIENMKVFCFDLMIARLWTERIPSPRILIHDSVIFDPVDERQVARALELAARESERWGFQYICTMNTDKVPGKEFRDGFSLEPFTRLRLTDKDPQGSLLGIRF